MPPSRKRSFFSRRLVIVLVAIAAVVAAIWFWKGRSASGEQAYRTAPLELGDIRVAISATGTLGALSTVDVGSEVSGKVTEVLVDYNDRVEKGQVIARIDPSTFEAQIEQGDASIASARASLQTAQATLRNAELDYGRKAELVKQKLIARGDLDQALAARDQARAQITSAQAQIRQQQASTENFRLNLGRTVIRSPVNGVVLTRSIEPGQTVAASLQAPVLFKLAEDLVRMEIVLAVDESDIGQVKQGQPVSFSVDAFPDRKFNGTVRQIRLSATNTSNVITYPVVVSVDNSDQILLPGMTANAEIEVSRRDSILKAPNAAMRFKPPVDNASPEETPQRGGGISEELPKIAAALQLSPAQQGAFDAALTKLRERNAARAAAPTQGQNGGSALFGRAPSGQQRPAGGGSASGAMRQRMMERFNQQFAEFRAALNDTQRQQWDTELNGLIGARRAPVYVLAEGKPKSVMVRVGASDGSNTEISGDLKAGDEVIVGVQVAETGK
jgi:HlyD family secretion protein